ncbi:MAG: hypothetical protein E7665_02645 [Ruminococcaceae bacterium]|nr:hypothetical protein [Oscillospiraceae bacterium]
MALIYGIIYFTGTFKALHSGSIVFFSAILFGFSLCLALRKRERIKDTLKALISNNTVSLFKGFSVFEKIITLVFVIALLYKLSGVILLSPFCYDGIKYHLPSVVEYVKNGSFIPIKGSLWANAYPKGFETFNLWMLLFFKDGFLIKLPQYLTVLFGGVFCYGTLCNISVSRKLSFFASLLLLSTPVMTAQMNSAYVDAPLASMIFAGIFFISELSKKSKNTKNERRSIPDTVFFSLSVMLLLGIKYSALAYGAILFLLFFFIAFRNDGSKKAFKNLVVSVPICACGMYWYIYNLIVYKNLIFPFSVSFGGFTLFEGMNMSDVVMLENIPAELSSMGAIERILYSWFYHDSLPVYSYDSRIGGLGVLFPFLFLFGIGALCCILFNRKKDIFGGDTALILLSLLLMFIITPENWWARYTCFIVLFAVLGTAVLGTAVLGTAVLRTHFKKIKKAVMTVCVLSFFLNIFSSVGVDTYYYGKLFTDESGKLTGTQRYSEGYTEKLYDVIGNDKCSIISFRADCGGYEFYGKKLENEYSWYTYENFYKTSGKDINFIDDENEFCLIIENERPDYILISEPFFVFHIDHYMSTHNDYELIYNEDGERIYGRI